MYMSVIRITMFHGMKAVSVTKRQMREIEVAEFKMVRWAQE